MIDYEKKTGAITSKDINLDKIYNTAASAANGLKTVSISDSNQSWKSDKLTYKLLDNDVVMILNDGVPIGFTNINELKNTDTNDLTKQGYPDSKSGTGDGDLSQVTYTKKMDETFENNEVEVKTVTLTNDQNIDSSYSEEAAAPVEDASSGLTPQEEAPAQEQELTATVDESAAEEVKEEHNQPLNSGENAPADNQGVTATLDESAGEELDAENQQPPEPEVNAETIDAEIEDSAAEEVKEEEAVETIEEETQEVVTEYNEEAAAPVEEKNDGAIASGEEAPANAVTAQDLKAQTDSVFASLNGRDYSAKSNGGTGRCGEQAHDVLANMGLITDYSKNGIDFAKNMTNDSVTGDHTVQVHLTDYNSQASTLDQIIENGNGTTGPLVISFNSTGHYRNSAPYGHVVVVTGISDGKVYAIDSSDGGWNSGTTTIQMSVEEFKNHYFSDGDGKHTVANCITEIK